MLRISNKLSTMRNIPITTLTKRFYEHHVTLEPFMNGDSAVYIEELFWSWKSNPESVNTSWQVYFKLVESEFPPGSAYNSPIQTKNLTEKKAANLKAAVLEIRTEKPRVPVPTLPVSQHSTGGKGDATFQGALELANIIRSYQARGHLVTNLDPLKLTRQNLDKEKILDIKLPDDKSTVHALPNITRIGEPGQKLTLNEIIECLENSYCKSIAAEFNHVPSYEKYQFLKNKIEDFKQVEQTKSEKIENLINLCKTHNFESFLSRKWPAEKRFGIEGSDIFIPAMRQLVEYGSDLGAKSFIFGMAHRGRLNLVANVLQIPCSQIFSFFHPIEKATPNATGDVKYHLGTNTTVEHPRSKKPIRMTLISNASHLGTVNAIVEGFAYGDSYFNENKNQSKVWPILIHGDAAMSGQGIVYETFNLNELNKYKTGGTIHIAINNQVGFTVDPIKSRSSEYCTCIAKAHHAPIFHVNGEDVDAVMYAIKVAVEYKAKYLSDVVVDIVAYRRLGHNEVDEPLFTQPTMYSVIGKMEPLYIKYREKLINEKLISNEEITKIQTEYIEKLEQNFKEAESIKIINPELWMDSSWKNFHASNKDYSLVPKTGVKKDVLDAIGKAISTPPKNFNMHRGIQRVFNNRAKNLKQGTTDWAVAEAFAFGSLLQEGVFVRLSGQDVERGTFSHRHHVLHDQNTNTTVNVLQNVFSQQADYEVCNSALSEYGVLGFELGLSLISPNSLIMWEAQFGDFCNSAQIIIDQYLSSGESKWYRQSALVMLLPHGMEGMGPEHSSARPERFLQMCNDNDSEILTDAAQQLHSANWFIANPSTPVNMFHLLRRQVKLNFRKPLVIFTPKSLLRHPECMSPIDEYIGGTEFKAYIADPLVAPSKDVKKLLLCTGKIYYDLVAARKEKGRNKEIAIGRLEQVFPMPYEKIIEDALENFPGSRLFWVQEEHKNQGFWSFVAPRLNKALGKRKEAITYVGRPPSCSTATGFSSLHTREKNNLLNVAIAL